MFWQKIGGEIYDVSHTALNEPSEHLYYKHIHPYSEMLLFVEGDMDFCIGGDMYHLQPYDLLLIPQGAYHYAKMRTAVRYENYVIYFSDTLLLTDTMKNLFCKPIVFNIGKDLQFLRFFKLMDLYHEKYETKDFVSVMECLVREILMYCCYASQVSSVVIRENNSMIQRILDYIDEHLEEKLDVGILAEHLNVSCSHIQNTFSQNMQIGLKQYMNQKKIFAVHRELLNGASPTDLQEKYHFNDYSTFYRLYKKTFGQTPSQAHGQEE